MPRTSGSNTPWLNDNEALNAMEKTEGRPAPSKLKYFSLGIGILIIIAGIYTMVLGVTPAGETDDGMSTKFGCTLVLGLVFITTGGLFIIYSFRKRLSSRSNEELRTELKACPCCQKRVENDQTLCYHCGHEFG